MTTIRLLALFVACVSALIPLSPAFASTIWATRYHDSAKDGQPDDGGRAVAVDGAGNTYATGYTTTSRGTDLLTVRYDTRGRVTWKQIYDGANGSEQGVDIVADTAGNTYVTGYSAAADGLLDIVVVAYDPQGRQRWVQRYDGPQHRDEWPNALAIGPGGAVYVTGTSYEDSFRDAVTIAYSSTGERLWVDRYNGPSDSNDEGAELAATSSGVHVAVTSNTSGANTELTTIAYSSTGARTWVRTYGTEFSGGASAVDIAVDTSGNVAIAGIAHTGGSDGGTWDDYLTLRYTSDGTLQWANRYDTRGVGIDTPSAVDVDGSGNVYVTGTADVAAYNLDYTTISYAPDGSRRWLARYGAGPDNPTPSQGSRDEAADLVVTSGGDVVVTGASAGPDGGYSFDYATVRYRSTGERISVDRYDNGGYDQAYDIAAASDGSVYVTGESAAVGPAGWDLVTTLHR